MTIPTLTWTSTIPRAITIAGANSTIAELLAAINTAVSTDSTLWEVSDYSAVNGTVEIKRRTGTGATGEQATVRYLLFGGQVPNAAALNTSVTANNTNLYVSGSVTANTTGPSTGYQTGAPYAVTYMTGNIVCVGTAIQSAQTPRISIIESVDAIAIWLADVDTVATVIMGKLIIDAANSATDVVRWCHLPMGAASTNITSLASIDGTSNNFAIPAHYMSAFSPGGCMWNGTAARRTGRLIGGLTGLSNAAGWGSNGAPAFFLPVPMGDSTTASSTTVAFYGFLRQIRMGPSAQHRETLRLAGVEKGIHFGPCVGFAGFGAWFDQTA